MLQSLMSRYTDLLSCLVRCFAAQGLDHVLMATGRKPNTHNLGLEEARWVRVKCRAAASAHALNPLICVQAMLCGTAIWLSLTCTCRGGRLEKCRLLQAVHETTSCAYSKWAREDVTMPSRGPMSGKMP